MNAAEIEHLKPEIAERNAREPQTAFIRIARVKEISGLSKSTLWRWLEAGQFPRPVSEEGNSVLWDLAEVMAWRQAKCSERDQRIAEHTQAGRA